MKARVSNLIKTEAEWLTLDFKPLPGELVIYAPDNNFKYARIKIGDGDHSLKELPFVIESIAETLIGRFQRAEEFEAGRITDYIN